MQSKIQKSYRFEKIKEDTRLIFNVFEVESAELIAKLSYQKPQKTRNKKLGCLFFLLALFLDAGELSDGVELDDDIHPAQLPHLVLENSVGGEQIIFKKVWRGVVLKKGKNVIGSLKFKKRQYVCKYEIKLGDKWLGKLVPNGISHTELKVADKEMLLAEFTKSSAQKKGTYGFLHLYSDFSQKEIRLLLGALLLWH